MKKTTYYLLFSLLGSIIGFIGFYLLYKNSGLYSAFIIGIILWGNNIEQIAKRKIDKLKEDEI